MAWWDFFKTFTYAFRKDPLSKRRQVDLTGAGISQPDAIPDIRAAQDGTWGGGRGTIRLRDTNDFVDLSTVTNRIHRYKEYERLRNVAEIEMAMTVFADETCLHGNTKIATPYGWKTIKELAEENPEEPFLVYCYDFEKQDYTLGWAFNPRLTKKNAETIRVVLSNGKYLICTPDHKVLLETGQWKCAGDLSIGERIMPFHKVPPRCDLTQLYHNQFDRIWTRRKGWVHEKQFIDEWRYKQDIRKYDKLNEYCQQIIQGTLKASDRPSSRYKKHVEPKLKEHGFCYEELIALSAYESPAVIGVLPDKKHDVYDLSVMEYENFATEWGVVHNCQKDDEGRVFKIHCSNQEIVEELEFLFFSKKMLNFDQKKMWNIAKRLFIYGDFFFEVVIDPENPKDGIINLVPLPPDSMYRIETTKGKLVEFQQSREGPDYQSLARVEVTQATEADLQQATAIRFAPEQIIHIRIGDDRKTFYPYGVSLIEAARGPAHQLRLMEDAMVVYRLTRAPERLVFYIEVANLPSHKAEAFIERLKDQFRKKKVASMKSAFSEGASTVEERWHAVAADENYWLPIRPNSNTRIETLPGAQNLGEIDDTIYFRNKLFTALQFPRNYFNNEDPQTTRISLSAQDIKFARMIERLQSHIEDALWEIADRHLRLIGYPEEAYEDLEIKMTPPSDWRELTRAEVVTNRINNASTLKGSQLMSDYDILTKWMKYPEDEAKKILARLKIQKLEELKMQIIAQNPQLMGIGLPGPEQTGEEISTEPTGQNPMLGGKPEEESPQEPGLPPGEESPEQTPPELPGGETQGGMQPSSPSGEAMPTSAPSLKKGGLALLPEPTEEDIKKFHLDIQDYSKYIDEEEIDASELA